MKTIALTRTLAVGALSLAAWVAGCSSSSSPTNGNGTSANTCNQACDRALAANCPNDTRAACTAKCQNPFPSCQAQFDAVAACVSTATFTCINGSAKPQGCNSQETVYGGCVFQAFDGGFN